MLLFRRDSAALARAAALLALLATGCAKRPEGLVLVSIDTLRADALGCYGGTSGATPHIDGLAKEGTVFVNATSPVPITLPAHASILTGLSPARHGLHLNLAHVLHPDVETLAESLAKRGFATGGFVSALVLDGRYGLDQGFGTWDDEMSRALVPFGAERRGRDTVARALEWLEEHRGGRFFLFVHLYEPHEPYEPPPALASRFPSPYLAEVAAADAAVGELLAGLRGLGLDRTTAVAVVGDHGEMLGEHGEETHTYFVYQSALRVPFVLRTPHGAKDLVVPRLAGLVDVTPTLCGVMGVDAPKGADGVDLSPLLEGKGAPAARPIYCESQTPTRYGASALLGLVGERWKYIRSVRPELYDLSTDAKETRNLAAAQPSLVARHDRELSELLARPPAGRAEKAAGPDSEEVRKLAALGYLAGGAEEAEKPEHQADPKDLVEAHVALTRAMQLLAAGRFAEAEPYSRRFLERLPGSWEAHLTLGKVALGLGEEERAAALFGRSLELKPAQYDALEGLGRAWLGLRRFDRAAETFRRALPLDAEPPRALFLLAGALLDAGRPAEAERFVALGAPIANRRPERLRELDALRDRLKAPDEPGTVRGRGGEAVAE